METMQDADQVPQDARVEQVHSGHNKWDFTSTEFADQLAGSDVAAVEDSKIAPHRTSALAQRNDRIGNISSLLCIKAVGNNLDRRREERLSRRCGLRGARRLERLALQPFK